MNKTNFEHLAVALFLQAIIGLATGNWLAATLLPIGIFLGREHAQREYKIGNPSLLIGYEALDLWRWSKDALLDLFVPVLGVTLVYYYAS